MNRTLSMLLVLALLLSCLPMGALATEVETEPAETIAEVAEVTETVVEETEAAVVGTAEVITDVEVIEEPVALAASDSLWQDDWGSWYFSDFEGLKQLAAMDITNWTYVTYQDTEPLVIGEDLSMPANLYVDVRSGDITVPAGVTFTVAETLDVRNLTVEGTANLNNVNVFESVNVSGLLNCSARILLINGATASGNIVFTNSQDGYLHSYTITTAEDLKKMAAEAQQNNETYIGGIHDPITLTEDITIPANCSLYNDDAGQITIANGVTLTLNSNMDVFRRIIVNGTLVNNGTVNLASDQVALEVAPNGAYSGNGEIRVSGYDYANYTEAVSGLNLESFDIVENEGSWSLRLKPDGPYQNEYGWWEIYDFDDLKQLVAQGESSCACYNGTEPLVIGEDMEILMSLFVDGDNGSLIIPTGVTVTAEEIFALDLTVNGTLSVVGADIANSLTVNGKMNVRDYLTLNYTASLDGYDNVTFTEEWDGLLYTGELQNFAQVKEMIAMAAAETDPRIRYHVMPFSDMTFTEDLTIPQNCIVYLMYWDSDYNPGGTFTIPAGVTIANNGVLMACGPLNVQGSIVNNSSLDISNYQDGGDTGKLIINGGTYSGSGVINVNTDRPDDYTSLITGLDLYKFEATQDEWGWELTPKAEPEIPDGPYQNEWGCWEIYDFDDLKEMASRPCTEWTVVDYRSSEMLVISEDLSLPENLQLVAYEAPIYVPAGVTFTTATEFSVGDLTIDGTMDTFGGYVGSLVVNGKLNLRAFLEMDFYEELVGYENITFANQGTWISKVSTSITDTATLKEHLAVAAADTNDRIHYNFNLIDIRTITESVTVPANTWIYVNYSHYVTVASGATLTNNGGVQINASLIVKGDLVNNAQIAIDYDLYAAGHLKIEGTYSGNGSIKVSSNENIDPKTLFTGFDWNDFEINESHGDDYYNWLIEYKKVENQLNNILQGSENLTDEEVREAVQELDTQKLKDSLLAEDAVQQQIAILEEQVGGPAEVAVSNEVAMDANEISVVGANLNNAASADEDIKLVIDKPEEEHVLEAAFDNSVAFKFSMTLDNVEDAKNLDVPVKITMPVPAGVNPAFLVILHYHADGTREEIGLGQYNISGNGDKLYVSFVVTSFSDFVITQMAAENDTVWGDADGDGDADYVDSMMIAQYDVFLLEDHEINLANCDVDGNGFVDYVDSMLVAQYDVFLFDKFPVELES